MQLVSVYPVTPKLIRPQGKLSYSEISFFNRLPYEMALQYYARLALPKAKSSPAATRCWGHSAIGSWRSYTLSRSLGA